MSKKNNDFFKEKKAWSEVKDELLGCYFRPYVQKILHTYKPLVYVDCFAGKGKFEDGKPGSPLIALDIINECVMATSIPEVSISTNFIDLNYANDLKENLKDYPFASVHSGKYEDKIIEILENKSKCNVFLYIDPYGIKALNCEMFDGFSKSGFNSIELLINMNSFGFIREACHVMGTQFNDETLFDDLIEYDPTKLVASKESIQELNIIAGGDYWQSIINDYKENKINGYEAEIRFSDEYCKRLMKSYKYVLNLPLRIKRGQRPKYRLIHATNHKDGCLLMVDNIYNRWQALRDIQNSGQISMFEENFDNELLGSEDIENQMVSHFSKYKEWISLHELLAKFFVENGAICSTSTVKEIVKKWEKVGIIEVERIPNTTIKGKPSSFMTEAKGKSIFVRWK